MFLFIDLDHFKAVNDRGGHALGDACLVAVAEVLKAAVRKSDSVARVGGDEFVVLIDAEGRQHAKQDGYRVKRLRHANDFQAKLFAQLALEVVEGPQRNQNFKYRLDPSVGA